jgi:uncharacterized protein (TIGR03437 family)
MLGGVSVFFDGTAAPLLYVSSTRITAIVPFAIASQQQTIVAVKYGGVSSNQALLGVVPAVPGIFTSQAVYQHLPVAAALNEDGSINSENNRATPGSIVSIFATGLGALMPQPVDGSIVSGALPGFATKRSAVWAGRSQRRDLCGSGSRRSGRGYANKFPVAPDHNLHANDDPIRWRLGCAVFHSLGRGYMSLALGFSAPNYGA